jgi:hypothetical protein
MPGMGYYIHLYWEWFENLIARNRYYRELVITGFPTNKSDTIFRHGMISQPAIVLMTVLRHRRRVLLALHYRPLKSSIRQFHVLLR